MTTRRDFVKTTGIAVAALSAPWSQSLLAADQSRLSTRLIPGTDETLPVVGLGNAKAFGSGDMELSRQLVGILMDRGGSYIDTTGRSRFTIAGIMREGSVQARLFPGTYVASVDDAEMREEIAAVREAQGDGGPLDLVLTRHVDAYAAGVHQYQRLKEEGLTRYVGVARHQQQYHETMMQLMEAGAVDFVQVNYSMLEPEAGEKLLPMAEDLGIAILVNRPFVNGDYFRLVRGHELPEWAAEFDCESWAQFSVKFIVSHPAVNCVLTETSNPQHAADNISGGIGRLPDEKTRQRMLGVIQDLV